MPKINTLFRKFHDTIKLGWDDELEELRDKRDEVLDALFAKLPDKLPAGVNMPQRFNQGSYAMHTGILPINGDYDIDVGLEFELDIASYPRPVDVKRWVYDALYAEFSEVEMREPCVTVWWRDASGEPLSHVDLAIYATKGTKTHLARSKLGTSPAQQEWERADPRGLLEHLRSNPEEPKDREQMHRVIRYLKRWKDHRFAATGEDAPRGIALTACALKWFAPHSSDLDALSLLVEAIHARGPKICARVPVAPHTDTFAAMNTYQRNNCHARIGELKETLRAANDDATKLAAAKCLRVCFGDDFPLPSSSAAAAIGTSGASA